MWTTNFVRIDQLFLCTVNLIKLLSFLRLLLGPFGFVLFLVSRYGYHLHVPEINRWNVMLNNRVVQQPSYYTYFIHAQLSGRVQSLKYWFLQLTCSVRCHYCAPPCQVSGVTFYHHMSNVTRERMLHRRLETFGFGPCRKCTQHSS